MAGPRHLLFSGKGGVGKTTLASAAALRLARQGKRTLLVTTDPASNLADVFQQDIGPSPVTIKGVPRLAALEIDAVAAARAYRERALAPLRELFPPQILRGVEEQMSGPCTEEIAGFDRFIDCLDRADYERVVFDTAPTGHTLRLLELPSAWTEHLDASATGGGQTCLGPVQALAASREQYRRAMAILRSPAECALVLVAQGERTAVEETLRSWSELTRLEIVPQALVVNGLIPPAAADNPFFRARCAMQERQLAELARQVTAPVWRVPLCDFEIQGLDSLEKVGELLAGLPFVAA